MSQEYASTLYSARIFRLRGERRFWLFFTVLEALFWYWLPEDLPEPRYRILVRRTGTEEEIGVRVARSRKHARLALADVEAILRTATEHEARALLGLQA